MTSPVLKINICESCDCTTLTFSELTGVYNSVSNTGGWNVPNQYVGTADSAELTITRADGNVYLIDLFTHAYPTVDTTLTYSLVNEDFGYTTDEKIPDQIMTFKYTVTGRDDDSGAPFTVSTTIYKGFFCQTKCCINRMLLKIDFCCENCLQTGLNDWLQAKALYEGMMANANCGNITQANNNLAQLNKICKNSNCGCS